MSLDQLQGMLELSSADYDVLFNDRPPLPLSELPFFFGFQSPHLLSPLLKNPGDYLLLQTNDEVVSRVTLMVKSENGNNVRMTIDCDSDGSFWLQKLDTLHKFKNIDTVIRFYQILQLKITASNGAVCRLKHPILRPDYIKTLKLEGRRDPRHLSYYHGQILEGSELKYLEKDGDFFIYSSSEVSNLLWLCIRWNGDVKRFSLPLSIANDLFYRLPSEDGSETEEFVSSIDELIKAYVRIGRPIAGVFLKRAISVRQKSFSFLSYRTEIFKHHTETSGQVSRNLKKPLLNNEAPRPFHLLPYYHGHLTTDSASHRLLTPGQFLLYTDKEDRALKVICGTFVKDLYIRYGVRILRSLRGYFYIKFKDKCHKFLTVEELIEYYRTYRLPIKPDAEEEWSIMHQYGILIAPVVLEYRKHGSVSNAPWSPQRIDFNDEIELNVQYFQREGDFMVRKISGDPPILIVKHKKHIEHIIITGRPGSGTHSIFPLLPREHPLHPQEAVNSIETFLQSIIVGRIRYNGVILARNIGLNLYNENEKSSNVEDNFLQ